MMLLESIPGYIKSNIDNSLAPRKFDRRNVFTEHHAQHVTLSKLPKSCSRGLIVVFCIGTHKDKLLLSFTPKNLHLKDGLRSAGHHVRCFSESLPVQRKLCRTCPVSGETSFSLRCRRLIGVIARRVKRKVATV